MGLGSSSISSGNVKDSGDAEVQFGDRHTRPPTTKNDKSATLDGQASPLTSTPQEKTSPVAVLQELSPSERATTFSEMPDVPYIQQDDQSQPWKTDYSPSSIKSKQTSPSSYRMTSEPIMAFPSPTSLHSPPMSYSRKFNQTSHVLPKQYRSTEPTEKSPSPSYRGMKSCFFYSSMPSPSWKPLSMGSYDSHDNSCTSVASAQSWSHHPASHWDGLNCESVPTRKADHGYYDNGTDDFYLHSPKESSYF